MLQLVTHRPSQPQPKICFYILNKGSNSGKPLTAPCANCFVAYFENENEKEFYYWLCWAMWQAKQFEHLHCGSVILFIRKNELYKLLQQKTQSLNKENWSQVVTKVKLLHEKEMQLRNQIELFAQLKTAFLKNALRG